jgi:hypothetical protein
VVAANLTAEKTGNTLFLKKNSLEGVYSKLPSLLAFLKIEQKIGCVVCCVLNAGPLSILQLHHSAIT